MTFSGAANVPIITPASGTASSLSKPPTRTIITATGTYTTPAGCLAILVECVGAGGGGGGTPGTSGAGNGQCAAGAGGGGGAYAAKMIANPAASYTVTVGAGGTATSNTSGGSGGDTIFGSNVVVAKGGSGGSVGVVDIGTFPDTSGGAVNGGDSASCVGDIVMDGGSSSGGLMFRAAFPQAGQGGASAMGGGVRLSAPNNGTFPGHVGNQYGTGGSGSSAKTSATAQAGGVGGAGVIIVTEFY